MPTIVHVKVRKGKTAPVEKDGLLFISTLEKMENNRANLDVINQIARYYSVDIADVRLIKGKTSRKKVFSVQK